MLRSRPLSGLFLPSVGRAARRRPSRHTSAALAACERLEERALLTAFVVNSLADGPVAADGQLTLREALTAANTNAAAGDAAAGTADGDAIAFAAGLSGTVTLTQGQLAIGDDVSIDGGGRIVIDAAGLSRVLLVGTGGAAATLAGLTLRGGRAVPGASSVETDGGGILIERGGAATLSGVVVTANAAESGGGIYNRGTLVVDGSSAIASNRATYSGGGIHNDGVLRILGSSVVGNVADGIDASGGGGGVFSGSPRFDPGRLIVYRSVIDGNVSGASGGGVAVQSGEFVLDESVVSNNSAGTSGGGAGGHGGGVYVASRSAFSAATSATIHRSTVRGNAAGGTGGGIHSDGGQVTVYGAAVEGNAAKAAGGGVEVFAGRLVLDQTLLAGNAAGTRAGSPAAAVPGDGGGLHVGDEFAATVIVHRSDVRDNTASRRGGGLRNRAGGSLTVDQSYVWANRAYGAGDADGGGGVFNDGGSVLVAASVLQGNAAVGETGSPSRPAPASGSGGGIASSGGKVVIYVSTLAENFAFRAGGGASVSGGRFVADRSVIEANTAGAAGGPGLGYGGGLSAVGADALVYLYFSEVRNNGAYLAGGGLRNLAGGTLIVNRSVVVGNVARGAEGGGGIFNAGDLAVVRSYVTDNGAEPSAELSGGGLYQAGGGSARVERSVVTRNRAGGSGGGVYTETGAVTDVDALESVFANLPDDFAGSGAVV